MLRPVDTIRTEQPEDPWQSMEDPWAVGRQDWWRGRARGNTDVYQNSWNDPWLEQDPWSEATPNGTWRRPREGWRDPWDESTPAVGQREGRPLDWGAPADPWGAPADPWGGPADPWGAYADPWADACPEDWLL